MATPDESGLAALRMPSLGADMEFGTLVEWRVKPGDVVRRGDVVAEVETQKGVFEIDVRADAVVGELLVSEGTKVKVGAPLARLEAATPAAPSVPSPATSVAPSPAEASVAPAAAELRAPGLPRAARDGKGPRASPLARRIARDRGVDLSQVQGTGEGGVITKADVERAAGGTVPDEGVSLAASITAVGRAPAEPARTAAGMREAIAAAMARSKREIPHYYLSEDIDLGRTLAWLREVNASRALADRILPAAVLLRAVARVLPGFPALNGHFVDGSFRPGEGVHLGVAISLRGGGLVAPAIHDASTLSLGDLMQRLADLVRRARQGGLRASEVTDATATVTNLGDEGVRVVQGVIIPPQVAIIGFGAIEERPWAEGGLVGARPVVTATLSADHRVSDGWHGARFLRELRRVLAEPEAT